MIDPNRKQLPVYYRDGGDLLCWACVLDVSHQPHNVVKIMRMLREYGTIDPRSPYGEPYNYAMRSLYSGNTAYRAVPRINPVSTWWERLLDICLTINGDLLREYDRPYSSEPITEYPSDWYPCGYPSQCERCGNTLTDAVNCAEYDPDCSYNGTDGPRYGTERDHWMNWKQWCYCDDCQRWRTARNKERRALLCNPFVWRRLAAIARIKQQRGEQRLLCGHWTSDKCTCKEWQ